MPTILQALLLDLPESVATPRLALRANRAGHGDVVNEAFVESQAQLRPWMPWARETMSPEQSEEHCRRMQARWLTREELDFCFFRAEDGVFVGKGGLHTIDWAVPKFEIGYWVRTSCAGRGYATEAAHALMSFAHDHCGARRLEITCDTRNAASRRVAEKCGFQLEGIRRQSRRDDRGELADACMYARVF